MNKTILIGRLCADPEIRYTQDSKCIARYRLAVDRRFKKDGEPEADFISCVAFGKSAEFAEKYLHKGIKIAVCGRINTGAYTDKDGNKRYTMDVIADEQYFCESKNSERAAGYSEQPKKTDEDGFVDIPDGFDEGLPFA